MTDAMTTTNSAALVRGTIEGFSREQIELIKRTIAKDATDDELRLFATIASRHNLDPFKREIFFAKVDGRPTIMTSRDGYLTIAQRDPDFDGLQSFVVREGDEFSIDAEQCKIHHRFGAKRGQILGAWAIAYHKRRRPQICYVEFSEYNKNNNTWRQYPSAMIQKVAESFVLKRQFNISGLVTQEELESDSAMGAETIVTQVEPDPRDAELHALWDRLGTPIGKRNAVLGRPNLDKDALLTELRAEVERRGAAVEGELVNEPPAAAPASEPSIGEALAPASTPAPRAARRTPARAVSAGATSLAPAAPAAPAANGEAGQSSWAF